MCNYRRGDCVTSSAFSKNFDNYSMNDFYERELVIVSLHYQSCHLSYSKQQCHIPNSLHLEEKLKVRVRYCSVAITTVDAPFYSET